MFVSIRGPSQTNIFHNCLSATRWSYDCHNASGKGKINRHLPMPSFANELLANSVLRIGYGQASQTCPYNYIIYVPYYNNINVNYWCPGDIRAISIINSGIRLVTSATKILPLCISFVFNTSKLEHKCNAYIKFSNNEYSTIPCVMFCITDIVLKPEPLPCDETVYYIPFLAAVWQLISALACIYVLHHVIIRTHSEHLE